MKKILFFSGGWAGHKPAEFTALYAEALQRHGFDCQLETDTACLTRLDLSSFDLIVPNWTMGEWAKEESQALQDAVAGGVNLGGFHGGLGDAFRGDVEFKWMVGGMFVGHPHVGEYSVEFTDKNHVITAGLPPSFPYDSEQYYLFVDPAAHVLADTAYTHEGQTVRMPVAWTKTWGQGRVFYCALGHAPEELTRYPIAFDLTIRGLRWAAGDL